jgi:hypothetical protein
MSKYTGLKARKECTLYTKVNSCKADNTSMSQLPYQLLWSESLPPHTIRGRDPVWIKEDYVFVD